MRGYSTFLLVSLFGWSCFLTMSAQVTSCENGPALAECRARFATNLQSSLKREMPNLRVRDTGELIVFTEPTLFQKQENRAAFHNSPGFHDLELKLCQFRFTKIRVEAGSSPNDGEEYPLRCSESTQSGETKVDNIPPLLRRPLSSES